MKKFFSLKMALAVLVAGAAFASCSDSDAGDIYVPGTTPAGSTEVKLPAAKYVVNGVVTDAGSGAAIEGVAVSGVITTTTDANGFFTSGAKDSPLNGVLTFTKAGYATVNRTLVMIEAATGVVSEAMNVVMAASGAVEPAGTVIPSAAGYYLLDKYAKQVPAAAVAALYNDTDQDKTFMLDVTDLDLPYGAVVPAAKGDFEDALAEYVLYHWGNDVFAGFGNYAGSIAVFVPAGKRVVALLITPIVFPSEYVLGDQTQSIDVIDGTYFSDPTYADIDAHDAHDPHNGDNVGGGSSEGV